MKEKKVEKQKKYYDVKIECFVPTTLIYRVYAADEHDALSQVEKMERDVKSPTAVKPNLFQRRKIKSIVYDSGSTMIRLTKNHRS